MNTRSYLNNPYLAIIFLAILVKKLGGNVTVTQVDIDDIAYSKLFENGNEDGSVTFSTSAKPVLN